MVLGTPLADVVGLSVGEARNSNTTLFPQFLEKLQKQIRLAGARWCLHDRESGVTHRQELVLNGL